MSAHTLTTGSHIVQDMFADACSKASEFTRPLAVSIRHQDGSVETTIGSFIVINREGWVLTAGHMYDSFVKYQSDLKKAEEIKELNSSRASKRGAPSSEVKLEPSLITNHSFWWGWDGVRVKDVFVNRQLDIAVGKLDPFNPDWVREYPVFRDPTHLRPGTSVCRGGFAFTNLTATWNEAKKSFQIPQPSQDSLFFNEGMHTRTVCMGKCKDGSHDMLYVETSTPGLRGQSGGPIFDTKGRIYAMQVSTQHMDLGFHPTTQFEGRRVVENQFLNVGLGVHARILREVLDERGIRYDAEGDESGFRIVE